MTIFTVKKTWIIGSFTALMIIAMPAYAIFAKLTTNLIAAVSINGVKPSGSANLDQSKYPTSAATLSVKVSNVNLADGSILSVNLSDCPYFGAVAFIKVFNGSAGISTSLPKVCQIGRLSSIDIRYKNTIGDTIILKGGSPWKI